MSSSSKPRYGGRTGRLPHLLIPFEPDFILRRTEVSDIPVQHEARDVPIVLAK